MNQVQLLTPPVESPSKVVKTEEAGYGCSEEEDLVDAYIAEIEKHTKKSSEDLKRPKKKRKKASLKL